MALKFIHFSDSHLGFSNLDLTDEDGNNIREEDIYKAFSYVIDHAVKTKPDFLIHAGDIFHRSSPSNRALIEASQNLQKLNDAGIPFYIIAGNHDFPKSVFTSPIHEVFSSFKNVKIFYEEKYEIIDEKRFIIHALPHINGENNFNEEAAKISVTDKSKPNILITHLSLPSYIMDEFGERILPEEQKAKLKDFDYAALGHWHSFKHFSEYGNVYYSGSTETISDNDMGTGKGFIEVEIDKTTNVEFKVIPTRYIRKIEIKDCHNKTKDEILNEIKKEANSTVSSDGIYNIILNDIAENRYYEITKEDLPVLLNKPLYLDLKKYALKSNEQISIDHEAQDLREIMNEALYKEFSDSSEFKKAKDLIAEIWDNVKEEEDDKENKNAN